MKIKWKDNYYITVEVPFDEEKSNAGEIEIIHVKKNDVEEVEVIQERDSAIQPDNSRIDLVFADKKIGYSIPKKWFEKVN